MEREELNFYLQQADREAVAGLCSLIEQHSAVRIVSAASPQTLMVPVHDPINSGLFYGGEVLVTSAVVQVDGCNGWAMVMDDDAELATHVAILDAAFAAGMRRDDIVRLAESGRLAGSARQALEVDEIARTKVNFELL